MKETEIFLKKAKKYLIQGEKKHPLKIGLEFEQFITNKHDLPPKYEGSEGIGAFLEALRITTRSNPVYSEQALIGLQLPTGGNISLEPGGQIELSGNAFTNLHKMQHEINYYCHALLDLTKQFQWKFFGSGVQPWIPLQQIPLMPKARYQIMRQYMPKVGTMGLNMMRQTTTVQVNLDYTSELDMVRKMRISSKLQPYITALFATSPFMNGQYTGYQSTRRLIWLHTDNQRTGIPSIIFQPDFSYEKWIQYVFSVPMYFVRRNEHYYDVAGKSFWDFLKGDIPYVQHIQPQMSDVIDQFSVMFPEVRLKNYIEMRGADSAGPNSYAALAAVWVGLLYHPNGLEPLEAIVGKLPDLDPLSVAKLGMWGVPNKRQTFYTLLNYAKEGLVQRRIYKGNNDESIYLEPLFKRVQSGHSLAIDFIKLTNEIGLKKATYQLFNFLDETC